MYEASDKNVTHCVRDPYLGKMRDIDAEEASRYQHTGVRKDVKFEVGLDDPLSAALFFAHLRRALHQPDIESVETEVRVVLSGLDKHQMDALAALMETSWAVIGSHVIAEHHYYEVGPEQAGALS